MSLNPLSFLSKALDPISKAIDNLHTSDEERLSIKAELLGVQAKLVSEVIVYETKLADAQANVIMSEANAESWIARSWRPITMLTFVGLIVYSQLTENVIPDQLWTVVQIGLGGYVAGRSLEKTAGSVVKVLKTREEV
tara:strand:- start:1704 stop:2117 length:414 start_codon:yes stop_codon:yes gene_type:complete